MSVLLETSVGDLVIDLDVERSPLLSKNFVKLVKARYFTKTLFYNLQPNRFVQGGDPVGDGTGGCSIYGLIETIVDRKESLRNVTKSHKRFLQLPSSEIMELNKAERKEIGRVCSVELGGVPNTVGSQILITIGELALDGMQDRALSLGKVVSSNQVLQKINSLYCDKNGRPYEDVRIERALVIHDPFPDPPGMAQLLSLRGIPHIQEDQMASTENESELLDNVPMSPDYMRPSEEAVPERLAVGMTTSEELDPIKEAERAMEEERREAKSRAVVLEMLGDLPSADVAPPENVLFVCKLNSVTDSEDLQLIFSRFDPECKAEVIRDPDTGDSLCFAFIEFSTKEQCNQAYFKMNNVLIDDRRIKVDFSQSVSKEWNRFTHQRRYLSGRRGRGRGIGVMGVTAGGRGGQGVNQNRYNRTDMRNPNVQKVSRWGPPKDGSGTNDHARSHNKDSNPRQNNKDKLDELSFNKEDECNKRHPDTNQRTPSNDSKDSRHSEDRRKRRRRREEEDSARRHRHRNDERDRRSNRKHRHKQSDSDSDESRRRERRKHRHREKEERRLRKSQESDDDSIHRRRRKRHHHKSHMEESGLKKSGKNRS